MEHQNLLHYTNLTELETAQGTGGTVTTVLPGVAYEHTTKNIRFNKKKITYFVTVNYKRVNGETIAPSSTFETALAMSGKTTKLKINAIDVEGCEPVSESVKLLISSDTSYDYLYKAYTAYTVTVNHMFSGETIACATTITTDQVAEGDSIKVSFMPETIPGYSYTGETPITLWVSGDTQYTIEYIESNFETIDLGLPSGTLWCSCNVGASSPEEYGNYYAWGEIATKTAYTENNYRFADGDGGYTKYGESSGEVFLDAEDDVAAVEMGGEWRMPNYGQYRELLQNCSSAWTTVNNVDGLLLTSNNNGNTIFFPAAGFMFESDLTRNGEMTVLFSCGLYDGAVGSFLGNSNAAIVVEGNDSPPRILGLPARGVIGQMNENNL